ncbi:(-)-kolavenyl diphosphate synthase TPS28, chloroplastic-like [Zingiber officinale]|uniref:(-)-kolavenyl diphosphate synthase TPS28, chloroplastic-like n=1 Tax=Zingiber officinale TaxID=94328 RepID=UPI001C4D11EA|nr:(-)-kolavenyl diphosphate synthase TPS28, chloroplastic-like [Zingiber officinale]XP_042468486.1 (-)-kolavenyl diphosphate synthase TPS28, chloroplastic-like [Zingiber officinale]
MVQEVKAILRSMEDGEISVSAYDTAWVALARDPERTDRPLFPKSLRWIANNQLGDGSWGDAAAFSAHDRLINTLACAVVLASWNLHPDKCLRGVEYVRENMWRLEEEAAEHMPIGFEVAFPSLMDLAKELGLEIPYSHPYLQSISAMRDLKLKRIPKQVLHEVPTTLLHSMEGMAGLDWEKLLRLQCRDGSFLFSPSSTAYALMQTGDGKCLKYLERIVRRFDGGVPNVYPVDLFEHLWVVDRLQRLGIARYFKPEIKDCLDYVHRYWTEDGICWAKDSRVFDIDDTSMGFRLLRLHGYPVSPDVLQQFEKDGEFVCFPGQSNQAVTGMYNLNRAAQVAFPGEEILKRAKSFSYAFLREKQAAHQLLDKWIITKDLPGEVEYALDFPWYASLPRVEARLYLEQYGGGSDIWIGKTLYRMPLVNNDMYLELAKLDFNHCQAHHQLEWLYLQKWYEEAGLGRHGVSRRTLLEDFFLAASCIFEPERKTERLGWVRTLVFSKAISAYFGRDSCTETMRQTLILNFLNADDCCSNEHGTNRAGKSGNGEWLAELLQQLVDGLVVLGAESDRKRMRNYLLEAWIVWLSTWKSEEQGTGVLLVRTIEACGGRFDSILAQPHCDILSSICDRLLQQKLDPKNTHKETLEEKMRELAQCVLQSTSEEQGLDLHQTKQTFLLVAKSFYYVAHCSEDVLNDHIAKVLFQPAD